MHKILILSLSFLILSCNSKAKLQDDAAVKTDTTNEFVIAFGSCNKHNETQDMWDVIAVQQPDLWIWLGDMIYGDTKNMSKMKEKYVLQNQVKEYADFVAEVPIIGTWDDHDYGVNNGDKFYPMKKESRDLALDFLRVPKKAQVWNREGLYQNHEYTFDGKLIRVILLDIRYFSDRAFKKNKKYTKDPKADILGKEQWKWLKQELAKEEDLLIIGSGIQFIPEEHRFEKWANFPSSRTKLFDLLDADLSKNIILLSGDRHLAEISKIDLPSKSVIEITSSGLTHHYRGFNGEPNTARIGDVCPERNFGSIKLTSDSMFLRIHKKERLHFELPIAW